MDCKGPDLAQLYVERTTWWCLSAREFTGPAHPSRRTDGMDHHGTRRHPSYVWLKLNLRRNRVAGQRYHSDDRARDRDDTRGPRRPGSRARRMPERQGRADHGAQSTIVCRANRRAIGGAKDRPDQRRHRLWW